MRNDYLQQGTQKAAALSPLNHDFSIANGNLQQPAVIHIKSNKKA
jgi:hypothetical protein